MYKKNNPKTYYSRLQASQSVIDTRRGGSRDGLLSAVRATFQNRASSPRTCRTINRHPHYFLPKTCPSAKSTPHQPRTQKTTLRSDTYVSASRNFAVKICVSECCLRPLCSCLCSRRPGVHIGDCPGSGVEGGVRRLCKIFGVVVYKNSTSSSPLSLPRTSLLPQLR